MSGKNINFDDKKIKKSESYKNKKVTSIDDVNVNEILVSKKEPYGTKNALKCFIGWKFNENATMSFSVSNKQLLKNHNKIWEKIEKLLRMDFESKPNYGDDDKYIKQK